MENLAYYLEKLVPRKSLFHETEINKLFTLTIKLFNNQLLFIPFGNENFLDIKQNILKKLNL